MDIQRTVSTHLFVLYVTQEDTNQKAVPECKSGQFFLYWTIARREVGYLLDIQNIGHSKFDIQTLVKKAHTTFCFDAMHSQKTVST